MALDIVHYFYRLGKSFFLANIKKNILYFFILKYNLLEEYFGDGVSLPEKLLE
jgi:hypothetical protein